MDAESNDPGRIIANDGQAILETSTEPLIETTPVETGRNVANSSILESISTNKVPSEFIGMSPKKSSNWSTISSITPQNLPIKIESPVKVESNLIARLSSPVVSNAPASVVPDSGHTYAMAVTTCASPSGSTIHHLSQSSPRQLLQQCNIRAGTAIPLGNSGKTSPVTEMGTTTTTNVTYGQTNSHATSPISSPKTKRVKLEEKYVSPEDVVSLKKCILEYKMKHLIKNKENYHDHACELFFLQNGGNMMDYINWRKRPTQQLLQFLRENRLDSDEEEETSNHPEVKVPALGGTPVAISTTLPAAVTRLSQGGTPLVPESQTSSPTSIPSQLNFSGNSTTDGKVNLIPNVTAKATKTPSTPVTPATKPTSKGQPNIAAVYDSSIGSQEQIVERAKQEAYVMQRVAELRKEGLWSTRRLPKVQEPPRTKAHWDYLLEEMVWLATDFAQERKWKKAAAKKCGRMVMKHLQEQKLKEERAEKEESLKLRRIAGFLAKEIKQFWSNIEKVAEYKQQSIIDEKRKKALDMHLNFIVDQTEKYSSWLTQGLAPTATNSSCANSVASNSIINSNCQSRSTSPSQQLKSDDEFSPESETDDEETISKAENSEDKTEQDKEIELLREESELPIEDILDKLPSEILDRPASIHSSSSDDEIEEVKDNEYNASDEADSDDEATINEQEDVEKSANHDEEINELQAEGKLSMEELMAKYSGAYDDDFKLPTSPEELDSDDDSSKQSDDSEDEGTADSNDDVDESSEEGESEEVGMESLLDSDKQEPTTPDANDASEDKGPSKEISDIAATAESFQPKGYTLSTAQVCTKVPFLLKHQLREYQHIGLDWLVAMYDKKLNGILADEMGLGKTIQTIALLSHLACEKGVWGPHLIVVPTSVMLNWEMEFKKWAPAFKILTYYGSMKERKKKREGWTKPNTFHVCITSYKLVVQDHQSFRRKKWKYLILDEAQNIKNFKSQRWQYLLNLVTARRLLLTGTPLQNSLMELWSLMHFLMPNVFSSHKEFKEWFSNPMSGMIEGSHEYNDGIIKRLHKVLRPFLLRRLKSQVEKQLPQKYEHVITCRLSRRQRFLYDDFMSRSKTKETLTSGNFLSVINVLMQLRKVCNHPNMFEERPVFSPLQMEGITYNTASAVLRALEYNPLKHINLWTLNLLLTNLELTLTAFAAHRIRKFQRSQKLIEEIDSQPDPPPKCPPGKIRLHIRSTQQGSNSGRLSPHPSTINTQRPSTSLTIRTTSSVSNYQSNIKSVISQAAAGMAATPMTLNSGSGPLTVQIQQTQQGPRLTLPAGQIAQLPGFAQLVQTSTGQHILLTTSATAAQLLQQAQAQIQQQALTSQQSAAVTPRPALPPIVLPKPIAKPVATPTTTMPAITPPTKIIPDVVSKPVEPEMVPDKEPEVKTREVYELEPEVKALFNKDTIDDRKQEYRKEKLSMLGRINKRRCEACPLYGSDLIQAVNIREDTNLIASSPRTWQGMGYIHCLNAPKSHNDSRRHENYTDALTSAIHTPSSALNTLKSIVERYVFVVPPATCPSVQMHVSHPPPSLRWNQVVRNDSMRRELTPKAEFLHSISSLMKTQFPDRRLIQYDCGKLQILDRLLRQLKSGQHRILIFTQMTRMLDILEAFLNVHGHIYLRLDGATRVDQRQALMDRFNNDKRIFVFILSTRSGGVGVNLTGADTVIFYDSDWNPTMDAQAQDRCHRIGQTRDVHIYRLISERTIEENILKKANQKRLLGNIAIEGGNFTTAFFKENAIKDLFNGEKATPEKPQVPIAKVEEPCSQAQLVHALAQAEEESDVTAAKTAEAEAAADLAEFDETIPLDGDAKTEEPSQAEEEINQLMEQLKPVEKYALNFLESIQEPISSELLKQAEEEIEAQKENWELGRLQALKEEEERRAELEEESLPCYTYSREEAQTQVYISKVNKDEEMPIWCPPTPPQDDNDLYVDYSLAFMYDHSVMSETDLPPVYVRREVRKSRIDPTGVSRRQKLRKEETTHVPRSLFDRPTAALLKMRREAKLQKIKGVFRPHNMKPPSLISNKAVPEPLNDGPEWLIHEDWALLQTIQSLQELPLTLTVLSPAQTPNWDLVADIVNSIGRIFRSPKQCKVRYETALVPREEGRILYDANPKKQKNKTKGLYKTKNNRPMKTSQLSVHDNNAQFSSLYHSRYETIQSVTSKRTPSLKPLLSSPAQKTMKHSAVLAESGIAYEQPMDPVEVAALRAERIAREKQKSQQAAAINVDNQLTSGQRSQTILPGQVIPKTVASPVAVVTTKTITTANIATPMTVVQAGGLTTTLVSPMTTIASPAYTSALPKGIVVSQTGQLTPLSAVRAITSTTSSIQDQVVHTVRAIANASNANTQSATVVSVANLTPAQIQAAQRLSANLNVITTSGQQATTITTATTKTLTQAQLQLFRQTALLRHQRLQEQQLKQQQLKRLQVTQVQQAGGSVQPARISVAVTNPNTTTTGTVQVQVAAQIAQQRLAQQMVAKQQHIVGMPGKQTITRTMTEAEMTQLLKRQQLQQKSGGTIGPVTLTSAQLLAAQAQLQASNSSTNLHQTPTVATLVKTVSAPGGLSSGSSVTIPVSAVNVGGVSINVSLPQVKVGGSAGKVTTVTQQQQLRQFQIQQQLLQQQRKLQLQQQQQKVVSSLAQVAKVGGKTIPTQLGAVQIVQGQGGTLTAAGNQIVGTQQSGTSKSPATTVTVQQIHQVIKQVQQQHQAQAQAAQASSGSFIPVTTQISNPTIAVVSSSHVPQVMQQTIIAKPISHTSATNIQNIVPATTGTTQLQARVIPSISSSGLSKQTIQLLTGVHTIRPQNVTTGTAPKIISTQSIGTPTTFVKTIPNILQSIVTTTASNVKLSSNESGQPVFVAVSAPPTQIVTPSAEITTPVVSNVAEMIEVGSAGPSSIIEESIDVGDSSVNIMDDPDDENYSKDMSRSSPYPMRLRNPTKL